MGAGTVIFEGVRRKAKRNRSPQKARSIAEIAILNATFKKSGVHNIMCLWKNKFGLSFRLFQGPGTKINLSLKRGGGQVLPC
jgi:hypothetical protein